jgi:hypothetical protein
MINKIYATLICVVFVFQFYFAQDTTAIRFANQIKSEELKKYLSVLASDEYEGRETGEKGQKMAAEYIKNNFKSFGIPELKQLEQGYYQTFPLDVFQPQKISVSVNKKNYKQNEDYFTYSSVLFDSLYNLSDIVFAGYGINSSNYNDYEKLNVKNKTVLILNGEPSEKSGNSIISGTSKLSDWSSNFRKKITEAQKQEVAILLVADPKLKEDYEKNEHRINSFRMSLSGEKKSESKKSTLVIFISEEMATSLFNKNKINDLVNNISETKKPNSFTFTTQLELNVKQAVSLVKAENVLGYIEGTDLKNELVVITAHYDHLGKHDGVVYNGADDDGSGTSAVIELARIFAQAKKEGKGPRRSVLFMPVSGEEKGLLGSDYYTQHPVFPLASTVCNLNIDMIGRIDDAHEGDPNYVYLIGSDKLSKELHDISENANKTYSNLKLDYKYNDENDPNRYYYRSDHYNFAKNNVPVIFYFNGVHEDYHKETDEIQKINFQKMENITRLVFYTAWDVANRNERIKLNKK